MLGNTNAKNSSSGNDGNNIDYILSPYGITSSKSNLNGYIGNVNSYLLLQNMISTENYDKWEIDITYTHGYNGNSFNTIIGQTTTDRSGLVLFNDSSGRMCINLNGENDWIVADSLLDLVVQKGITYYMKIAFDSSLSSNQYSFYYRTGSSQEWLNSWNYTSSDKNVQIDKLSLIGSAYYASSRYDISVLNSFKFTGDNNVIFDLATAVEGTDFQNVGCLKNTDNKTIWFS